MCSSDLELRDSKKGKVRGHVPEFLIRIQQAKVGQQEVNMLADGAQGAARYPGLSLGPTWHPLNLLLAHLILLDAYRKFWNVASDLDLFRVP